MSFTAAPNPISRMKEKRVLENSIVQARPDKFKCSAANMTPRARISACVGSSSSERAHNKRRSINLRRAHCTAASVYLWRILIFSH